MNVYVYTTYSITIRVKAETEDDAYRGLIDKIYDASLMDIEMPAGYDFQLTSSYGVDEHAQ